MKRVFSLLLMISFLVVFTVSASAASIEGNSDVEMYGLGCNGNHDWECDYTVASDRNYVVYTGDCFCVTYTSYFHCTRCNSTMTTTQEEYTPHDWDLVDISCNGDGTDTYTYRCQDCRGEYYDEEQEPCIHG